MNILDIILAILLVIALINGLRKGLISQLIAIISLVVGVWLSFKFSSAVSLWLSTKIEAAGGIVNIISFALILIAVIFGMNILGRIIEGAIKLIMLGWVNKLLGALFGTIKCILILGLIITVLDPWLVNLELLPKDDPSILYSYIQNISNSIFPYLQDYLNTAKEAIGSTPNAA